MKLGTENKKTTIVAGGLMAVALILVVRMFLVSSTPVADTAPEAAAKPDTAPAAAADTAVTPPAPPVVRGPGGRERRYVAATLAPSLDPRLRLDMLKGSEDLEYEGTGLNIFQEHEQDAMPAPVAPGRTDKPGSEVAGDKPSAAPWTPKEIPPPPINLKFYGWASGLGEPKAIFLSQGDNVYVAHEGDIIARRYRVGKLSNTEVEIEDVLSNNKDKIPLTKEAPEAHRDTAAH
jgi:hypothetical protein